MVRKLYVSTGTMVERANGYDLDGALKEIRRLMDDGLCSGLELMMIRDFYRRLDDVIDAVNSSGIPVGVLHCEKEVGTLISVAAVNEANGRHREAEAKKREAFAFFRLSCTAAEQTGAKRMVLHLWGGYESDSEVMYNISCMSELNAIAAEYGVRLLVENVPSSHRDPWTNWRRLKDYLGGAGLIFDSRFGKLHEQIETIWNDTDLSPLIEHVHISDFAGTYRDFAKLRPILHPGEGSIDFDAFAALLDEKKYSGTITLESPISSSEGWNIPRIRKTLTYLNDRFCK